MKLVALACAAMSVALPAMLYASGERTPVAREVRTGLVNADMPPERYRGSSVSVVIFTDREGIEERCGKAEKGNIIIACHTRTKDGVSIITMPNPAPFGESGEWFAKIMAHENGHAQGWGREHEL